MSTLPSIVGQLVKDIAAYTFRDMQIGDGFETKGILSGVDSEPLKWRLVETNFSKTDLIFDVTYHGIRIGEYSVHPANNYKVVELA